jgi:hypothetical protein
MTSTAGLAAAWRASALPRRAQGGASLNPGWIWIGVAVLASLRMSDWLPALAIGVLWLGWRHLRSKEGPPVLALAFTYQWLQVTSGLFYFGLTGRERKSVTMLYSSYREMVLIGLGCLLALLVGLALGRRWLRERGARAGVRSAWTLTPGQLFALYACTVVLHGAIRTVAWYVPQLTQGLLALGFFRFALLFVLLRRLVVPRFRWLPFTSLVLLEVALGMTGFFAEFREPLMIATLVVLEPHRPRRTAHRAAVAFVGCLVLFAGLLWTGIKTDYRAAYNAGVVTTRGERLTLIASLSSRLLTQDTREWVATLDQLVDRVWQVYYPALALRQVPAIVPHTDGAILGEALRRIVMPRLFFPTKPELISDSERVRAFTGEWVAGPETGTSIAFGYAAESYVDFGLPWMFIPVFLYGLFMGVMYVWLLRSIWHRELAVAVTTVIMWLSLYPFERSWGKLLGLSVTLMVFLGGAAILLDRFLRPPAMRAPELARQTRVAVRANDAESLTDVIPATPGRAHG